MKKYITALLLKPENQSCADCGQHGPTWASLSFGVFICMNCSGIHRNLSVHHTRVKSTSLDEWNQEWVEIMAFVGNKKGNDYWEYSLPCGYSRVKQANALQIFIRDKYVNKKWINQEKENPMVEFNLVKEGKMEIPEQKPEIKSEPKQEEVNLFDFEEPKIEKVAENASEKSSKFSFIKKEKANETPNLTLFSKMKMKSNASKSEDKCSEVNLLDMNSPPRDPAPTQFQPAIPQYQQPQSFITINNINQVNNFYTPPLAQNQNQQQSVSPLPLYQENNNQSQSQNPQKNIDADYIMSLYKQN